MDEKKPIDLSAARRKRENAIPLEDRRAAAINILGYDDPTKTGQEMAQLAWDRRKPKGDE